MKRSKHSLSHYRLTSLDMGELFPVACEEVLPGDSFRHQTSVLLRVSALVAPVMHPVHVMVHHWYVPSRLLWSNWEAFITGRDKALVVPTLQVLNTATDCRRFFQTLGVGVDAVTFTVGCMAARAYNRIYNEYYRDQDLTTPLPQRTGDTGDLETDYRVRKCSWEKDYFTTARPYPQQGDGTETVPLGFPAGTKAYVKGIGKGNANWQATSKAVTESDGTTPTYPANENQAATPTTTADGFWMKKGTGASQPDVYADLSSVTLGTMDINQWRKSMAIQRMREHRNRFGSRYKDMLAFLGVNSSDARLDRPEYLGGGKQTIAFSEVLSTAETTTAKVGEMAGHGIAALRTRPYRRFFEEHGYMISLMMVRPASMYVNRVPRHFLRRDYEHYWQKELEMMGEQEITNFEVWGDATLPNSIFGYIPRYDEYRHAQSFVSGEFRTLLDYWHMGRDFTAQPVLNAAFVECDPTNRVYADTTTDQLYAMVAHRISARRLVSSRARS